MIRTLVADDDFMVASLHRSYTEEVAGFSVVGEAHSGQEVLRLARQLQPDLVLLDLYLPDIHGLQIVQQLQAHEPAPDVIVITAARDAATVQRAMQTGALHYIVKPFSLATFREKLERYAAWRAELSRLGSADQRAVDRLYSVLRPADAASLPKGLSAATLELVESVLREATADLSAAEVARAAGVSRVTARRYLQHLARTGKVTLTLRYGTAGRPEHRYTTGAAP